MSRCAHLLQLVSAVTKEEEEEEKGKEESPGDSHWFLLENCKSHVVFQSIFTIMVWYLDQNTLGSVGTANK